MCTQYKRSDAKSQTLAGELFLIDRHDNGRRPYWTLTVSGTEPIRLSKTQVLNRRYLLELLVERTNCLPWFVASPAAHRAWVNGMLGEAA